MTSDAARQRARVTTQVAYTRTASERRVFVGTGHTLRSIGAYKDQPAAVLATGDRRPVGRERDSVRRVRRHVTATERVREHIPDGERTADGAGRDGDVIVRGREHQRGQARLHVERGADRRRRLERDVPVVERVVITARGEQPAVGRDRDGPRGLVRIVGHAEDRRLGEAPAVERQHRDLVAE